MLTHLSLLFQSASDQQLKDYLAMKVQRYKGENEDLRINNQRYQEQLSRAE